MDLVKAFQSHNTDKLYGISHKALNKAYILLILTHRDLLTTWHVYHVYLATIAGLYLAKMYGIEINPSMMAPLAVTVILLSLGCPGVPGAGLVCLGIVLQQLGVPIGAMGLVIAIDPILDMFDTMSNTTGDVACALITAKKEKLLDEEIYYDMSRI